MATVERPAEGATHEVFNQASPLEDYNVFEADTVLAEAVRREGAGWAEDRCRELGALAGSAQVIRWGFEANERPPSSAPTTASATGWTRSSSTPHGTS